MVPFLFSLKDEQEDLSLISPVKPSRTPGDKIHTITMFPNEWAPWNFYLPELATLSL